MWICVGCEGDVSEERKEAENWMCLSCIAIKLSCLCVSNNRIVLFHFYCVRVPFDHIQPHEMRFNKQELATLATQPSNKFEKEGILYVTERQDGFFRRSEGKRFHPFFVSSLQNMTVSWGYKYIVLNTTWHGSINVINLIVAVAIPLTMQSAYVFFLLVHVFPFSLNFFHSGVSIQLNFQFIIYFAWNTPRFPPEQTTFLLLLKVEQIM